MVIGITSYDLTHNCTIKEAEWNEKIKEWHAKLLIDCSKKTGRDMTSRSSSLMNLKDTDHGYVVNLFRRIFSSESNELLMHYVVSRSYWIASQRLGSENYQYQQDMVLPITKEREIQCIVTEITNQSLVLTLIATNLSASFIHKHSGEV